MKEAIRNIIPRILGLSKRLDLIESFVDKSWVYIDYDGKHHEYNFMRDNRLIMTINGTALIGSWELLPNGKLLIDRISDKIVLKNQFIDDAVMILQRSSSENDPFLLVDQDKVPDLDVIKHLQIIEEKKNIRRETA